MSWREKMLNLRKDVSNSNSILAKMLFKLESIDEPHEENPFDTVNAGADRDLYYISRTKGLSRGIY